MQQRHSEIRRVDAGILAAVRQQVVTCDLLCVLIVGSYASALAL
jgi:hypothetical protein